MSRHALLSLALVIASACQGGSSDGLDGSTAGPATDAGLAGQGDGGARTDGDAGQGSPTDAAPAPSDANTAYEPVDCRSNEDCLGDLTCTLASPGGICNGCGVAADCGDDFECRFSACVRVCADDTECNQGKTCNFAGLCIQRRCGPNNPCPAPYECSQTGGINNFCQRPACGDGNSCPSGFTCLVSEQVCLEP